MFKDTDAVGTSKLVNMMYMVQFLDEEEEDTWQSKGKGVVEGIMSVMELIDANDREKHLERRFSKDSANKKRESASSKVEFDLKP